MCNQLELIFLDAKIFKGNKKERCDIKSDTKTCIKGVAENKRGERTAKCTDMVMNVHDTYQQKLPLSNHTSNNVQLK